MYESPVILLDSEHHGTWMRVTLGAPHLAHAQPGQFVALRCGPSGTYDPLLRRPLFVVETRLASGTCRLLVPMTHPAWTFLDVQPRGAQLDVLGPLGRGWQVPDSVRTLAMAGTFEYAPPLFALTYHAVTRNVAVSLVLGTPTHDAAPAPFLLPAAAEYNLALSKASASAALAQLDEQMLRWADMLAIAIDQPYWSRVAQRVEQVRIRWSRGFAQAAVLPPLACCVGVCGVCIVETRKSQQLACTDGPIFDLRDLVR